MREILPSTALKVIDKYLHLPLGNYFVHCPYFQNRSKRLGLRVYIGKGSPEEIVNEAQDLATVKKIDLNKLSAPEIRQFLINNNLGVDCSGLISQILWAVDRAGVRRIAKQPLLPNPYRFLISRLRPLENISVRVLTSAANSFLLTDWQLIKPGDIIKTRGGRHALIVKEIEYNDNQLERISYIHSTSFYKPNNGVRQGVIVITNPTKDLAAQNWLEKDENGRNYTYEGYLEKQEENGIYRLKLISLKRL